MAFSFDKIKGLFVVDDGEVKEQKKEVKEKTPEKKKETNNKKPVSTTKKQVKPPPLTSNKFIAPSQDKPTEGIFNQQIYDSLMQAISNDDFPGEDYMDFMEAFNAMKNIPLEEKLKMQTVLATLSTKGLTKEKIIESAAHYLKILDGEKSKFDNALKGQDNQINKKQKEIKTLEDINKSKSEQIKILTEEIIKNQEEVLRVKNDINSVVNKIKSTVNNFNVTHNKVAKQIKLNVQKIKQL